jgi:winged helix DNA-binding protein
MRKPVRTLAWRMRRQHLAARAPRRAALDVVRDICGLHAQLAASAELTLWARVEELPADFVSRRLWKDRKLVRTWSQRGTLHVLRADELGLWVGAQGALKPRHHVGSWLRYYGLTREQADAMLDAIPVALDGRQFTREELAAEVARLTGIDGLGDKLKSGFGELLKPAAFRGDLCFAPGDGQRVRFARPDQWLGPWEPMDTEVATLEVARRYLTRYGPANREALARWFGMPSPAEAGRWLKRLGDEAVEVDGEYMLAADVEAAATAEPDGAVRLLPAFDQYVVGAPRGDDDVVAAAHRARVYRPQAWLSPALVLDGRILGVWSRERKGGRLEVSIEPFGRVPRAVRAGAEAEADRLAAFLGADDVTVTYATER